MNINKIFKGILTECGGIEEMKKAFDDFIKGETEIRVGYSVKVADWGLNYNADYNWFVNNSIPRELCLRYSYGNEIFGSNKYSEDAIFKVLRIYGGKALITQHIGTDRSPCYLVRVDALEIAKSIMRGKQMKTVDKETTEEETMFYSEFRKSDDFENTDCIYWFDLSGNVVIPDMGDKIIKYYRYKSGDLKIMIAFIEK